MSAKGLACTILFTQLADAFKKDTKTQFEPGPEVSAVVRSTVDLIEFHPAHTMLRSFLEACERKCDSGDALQDWADQKRELIQYLLKL